MTIAVEDITLVGLANKMIEGISPVPKQSVTLDGKVFNRVGPTEAIHEGEFRVWSQVNPLSGEAYNLAAFYGEVPIIASGFGVSDAIGFKPKFKRFEASISLYGTRVVGKP